MGDARTLDELTKSCRLIVTAGCGGVGKTTVAASIALRAAEQGQRVAVLTIDPARRLAQALGIQAFDESMSRIELGESCPGSLDVMMLDLKHTGDALVHRFAPTREAARRILENRYYKFFSTSLAGSLEYMAIEEVRRLVSNGDHDLVVLDTPPTTHALDFLDAPERMVEGLERIPIQMIGGGESEERGFTGRLVHQGRHLVLRGLNRLTGGPFLKDLAEFLSEFYGILSALKEASQEVQTLLRDESTQFLLVTIPTVGRIDEALAFRTELRKRNLPLYGFILNRVHSSLGDTEPSVQPKALMETINSDTDLHIKPAQSKHLLMALKETWKDHTVMVKRDSDMYLRLKDVSDHTLLSIPRFTSGVNDLEGLRKVSEALVSEQPTNAMRLRS